MGAEVLSDRALNRATLARQLLLERSSVAPEAAVEHLVGLQAQNPLDPYLALWSRLEGFDPLVLAAGIEERRLVRLVVMRGTIHLLTAADAGRLRPLVQPVLDAEMARHSEYGPQLHGLAITNALEHVASVTAERPLSTGELRTSLAARFPELPSAACAYAARCALPLVQVPPRGLWGRTGVVRVTPLDAWVGHPPATTTIDKVVVRYLCAFGPATNADVTVWCRLTRMGPVVERLRPRLRAFVDERGRELVDLPDGLRPGPDVPAPVRVLPEYDNLLLSFADRRRFGPDEDRRFTGAAGPVKGTVLVDGSVRAIWHPEPGSKGAAPSIVVEHLPLARRQQAEVEAEVARAGRFWLGRGDDVDVRLIALAG